MSDAFLTDAVVSRYKAIVVPETRYMKAATLARLAALAKKMPVIFEKKLPASEPGLSGKTLSSPNGIMPVGDAVAALAKTAARPISFATAKTGVDAVRYRWNDGDLFFIVNSTMDEKTLATTDATVMDPMSGEVKTQPTIALAPAQSTFVWCRDGHVVPRVAEKGAAPAKGEAIALGEWSLTFVNDVSGWELPPSRTGDVLGDWTCFGDAESAFSGTAVYRTTFVLDAAQAAQPLTLSLGDVSHTARVRVNGQPAATLFMHPYATTIRGQAGTNVLEIEVTNLGANRIRAYDRKGVAWKTFEDANVAFYRGRGVLDASKWPVLPSGLLGPVALTLPRFENNPSVK